MAIELIGEKLHRARNEALARVAAYAMSKLEPGRQPLPLFTQLARLSTQSIVEFAPLRRGPDDSLEVLLALRDHEDTWWPDQWHLPGTVILATDKIESRDDFATPAIRALQADFGDSVELTGRVQWFEPMRRPSLRGDEVATLCWAEVDETRPGSLPDSARFFDAAAIIAGNIRETLVSGHQEILHRAVEAYMASNELL